MPQRPSRPLPTGWFVLWTVLLAVALGGFMALGTWQVHRMYWKHALIARVDGFQHAPPTPAPGAEAWSGLRGELDEYRRVALQGVLLNHEILVQANTRLGAGFWVMTPLRRDDGSIVFINRGFVDAAHRDPGRRGETPPAGPIRIEGLLRFSQPGGGFLRSNAPAEGRWYSRDVAAMAQFLGLQPVAPYFVDQSANGAADIHAPAPRRWPVPGLTVVHFRDAHLSYALTWYALAAMTAAAMVYGARQEWRRRAKGAI
ncbi:SURF1 family protein [Castellaniella ginsengisoli]|uniref:SURF1-like protein n=1 Tax=Castellaniella ginsengisoli TaxID=546114 RepID=A0AB39G426_9BURK